MAEISLTGDQMLNVLEAIARHGPVSASEVSRLCNVNRTVAHRLISTLAKRCYVRRTAAGYVLGSTLLALGRHLAGDIVSVAEPYLQRLASEIGETVILHLIDNDEAVVAAQALGNKHVVRVEHVPGSRHSLLLGASGWSLLAFQQKKVIDKLAAQVDDPQSVRRRVAQVQEQGYAISHDELQLGVHGLAAPIFEAPRQCHASVGILVPSVRSREIERFAPALTAITEAISKALAENVDDDVAVVT